MTTSYGETFERVIFLLQNETLAFVCESQGKQLNRVAEEAGNSVSGCMCLDTDLRITLLRSHEQHLAGS